MCNCGTPCNCPVVSVAPAVVGEPGPPTELTADVTILPSTDSASVLTSGVPPTQHLQFLLPAAPSPELSVAATNTLAAGNPASVTINNTDPLAPALTFNIPAGADGADGVSRYTEMTASFVMPAVGSIVPVSVVTTEWMSVGEWVYVFGAGWMVVQSVINATSANLRNPGLSDLAPSTGVPGNAAAGATIGVTGDPTQVAASGRMGPTGAAGDPGPTLDPTVVYVVPSSRPSGPEDYLRVYFNASPPSVPTVGQFYTWDGAAWVAGPNFVSQGGTTTYTGTADPNVAPPAGSKVLDLYIQFVGSNAVYWQRTAPSTWVTVGTVALLGTSTTVDTHTGGGTYTFDAAVFSHIISTDSDIDLDADVTNYDGNGTWRFTIFNSDASPHDLNAGGLTWSGIPTLPLSIGSLNTANVVLTRYSANGTTFSSKFVIEQAYIVS